MKIESKTICSKYEILINFMLHENHKYCACLNSD